MRLSTLTAIALTAPILVPALTAEEAAPEAEEVAPAEEVVAAEPAVADPAPVSAWTYGGEIGAYLSSLASSNAEESRDSTINGSSESINYEIRFTGFLDWTSGKHAVEQDLELKYGRTKEGDAAWTEKIDLVDYDGAYKVEWGQPHFTYFAWGADSVFTGSEPDEEPLDPFTGKVSVGYGQQHEWVEPHEQKFEWRVGVRAQKTWGRALSDDEREVEVGPEVYARYDAAYNEDLSYFAQYEAFGEFEDMGHWTNLLTAGLGFRLTKLLTLKLDLRLYYETEPEDSTSDVGYDEISLTQETLLGLTYSF